MVDLLAVVTDGTRPYRLITPFVVFICLLIVYIILLTAGMSGGPAGDAVLQATGQKIIAYAALAMVIVQSVLIRRMDQPGSVLIEEEKKPVAL